MGKNRNSNRNRNIPSPAPVAKVPWYKRTAIIVWSIIAGIALIVGGIVASLDLWDRTKSPMEVIESKRPEGDLTPLDVSDVTPTVIKSINAIELKDFNPNKELFTQLGGILLAAKTTIWGDGKITLDLLGNYDTETKTGVKTKLEGEIIDRKLYLSFTLRDLQNDKVVGIMERNHWTLYNENWLLTKENEDHTKLEIVDNQGYIILSIEYENQNGSPIIKIRGYFLSAKGILIISDHSFVTHSRTNPANLNWKQLSYEAIEDIRSIFPPKQIK